MITTEQRIELLEKMIPKIEIEQMATFARQLQDAYIEFGIQKGQSKNYDK